MGERGDWAMLLCEKHVDSLETLGGDIWGAEGPAFVYMAMVARD